MYDPTFHTHTLRRELTRGDQLRNKKLFLESECDLVVANANSRASLGYANVSLAKGTANNSPIYRLDNLADELVLRKIGRNIKRITRVRQSNRSSIIQCLKCLCSEGVSFRLYKVDLKKFYESIQPKIFLTSIVEDTAFAPSTIKLLASFFEETARLGIPGLPRGLGLSSILSEYAMRRFDTQAAKIAGVFFYARFVDDMVFITRGDECARDFSKGLNRLLPTGLTTNPSKTRHHDFLPFDKKNITGIESEFAFLGYVFRVSRAKRDQANRISRDVEIDISEKKIRRIKTRICIAFLKFIEDRNFNDLVNRIRLLSANYTLYDVQTGRMRKAGLFHSYHLIGPQQSTSLKELDNFYHKMVLSKNGKICQILQTILTKSQRSDLLRYSFERGFCYRLYFSFDINDITQLRRCWTDA